ncbi:hypothetical protein [Nocardioides sp. GXZ039]|uniref:hypothetical protein n=1 Tax=Nocardioides sp. GXZ039 TaxID=3136018 RepID=UPI0030F47E17
MAGIIDQLQPLYTEICELLGELCGNERYLDVLEAYFPTSLTVEGGKFPEQPEGTRMFNEEFHFPGKYGFVMNHAFWGVDLASANEHSETPDETGKRIAREAEAAWKLGKEAYTGYGSPGTLKLWGQNIWEPDPSTMSTDVDNLAGFARWLQSQLTSDAGWVGPDDASAPAWLSDLKKYWPATSRSSESFFGFWTDVNDKCALYLDAAQRLTATAAQSTATVNDFQKNLLEVTTAARDHARLALQQWQRFRGPSGAWPTGKFNDQSGAKTILGGVSYGTGVIALIPPVSAVAGTVSVITGGLSYVLADKVEIMALTSAAEAYDIWSGYSTDISKMTQNMRTALDAIHTRPVPNSQLASGSVGFEQLAKDVKASRADWTPPSVTL